MDADNRNAINDRFLLLFTTRFKYFKIYEHGDLVHMKEEAGT